MQIQTDPKKLENLNNISLDIDGTILPSGAIKLQNSLCEKIVQVKIKSNILSTLNSARPWHQVKEFANQISSESTLAPWEISGAGTFVTKPGDLSPYIRNGFENLSNITKVLKEIFESIVPSGVLIRGLTLERGYTDISLDNLNNECYAFAACFPDNVELIDSVVLALRGKLPIEEARIYWYIDHNGKEFWLQIMPPNVSKGSALDSLERSLGIDENQSAHAGDSWNDLCAYRTLKDERNNRVAVIVDTAPKEMQLFADVIVGPPSYGIENLYRYLLNK